MDDRTSPAMRCVKLDPRIVVLALLLPLAIASTSSCQSQKEKSAPATESASTATVTGSSLGDDRMPDSMPRDLSWRASIASPSEPGERLAIDGIVYQPDGTTPAPDIILYLYHTDANGYYSPAPGESTERNRHGHLRGWLKTNERGEYAFTSIKPAPYPNGAGPAHIHMYVREPGKEEYYIDDYHFDDDTLLTKSLRTQFEDRGGSGIITLARGSDGVWRGRRDIVLGRNIPGYR